MTAESEFKGNFMNSKKQGWGREKFKNGDQYCGEFYSDQPHVKGSYIWADGTCY